MIEILAILILIYAVFKDILHYRESSDLKYILSQVLDLPDKTTYEEVKEKKNKVKEDLDNLIPLNETDPKRLLDALQKEEKSEEI